MDSIKKKIGRAPSPQSIYLKSKRAGCPSLSASQLCALASIRAQQPSLPIDQAIKLALS